MATMNISLPDKMKEWVEAQVATGRYANASDYVRDLVRRDERRTAVAQLQAEVDKGFASGFREWSPEDLLDHVRSEARAAVKSSDAA